MPDKTAWQYQRTQITEQLREAAANEACGVWQPCTGCHETNEGYETGHYAYSDVLKCYIGIGCSECGGLGAVWEYWTKEALDMMAEEARHPPRPQFTFELHPMDTAPSGVEDMEPAELETHEGSWAIVLGTNAKPLGWIDTHEPFKNRVYLDRVLT
ncbi:hypothetical protein SAMN05216456_1336 [Devosia crocina]|uniref:Uncharacterized protein n=1 Tax=Devosia crocina TaxID=429728 RepID=A0A1I7N9R2_9HYPH|nr:hypothetical protein [Devosia crocina]SFV31422.1 hypothetical protein SAMN05216456_1336 [Devosia crocina]